MPNQTAADQDDPSSNPQSPYSSAKLTIRDLTMPPIPNFDIPPSPPGSPPPESTAKFAHFLELKKRGVHFNSKLQDSSALRNPGLFQKLMDFAGIAEDDQYVSALPEDLAVPKTFPTWAYSEQLDKTQQRVLKKKEEENSRIQRERLEFVSAADATLSSHSGTPPAISSREERVKPVLDKGKFQGRDEGSRRTERADGVKKSKFRSRSRSPKRRRSRSR